TYMNNNDPNYRMREAAPDAFTGTIIGGDLNTSKGVPVVQVSAPVVPGAGAIIPGIANQPTPMPEHTSSDETAAAGDKSTSKVSVSTILLIVAGIILLLALLGWFLYKRFKQRPAPTHEMTQYNNNEYALGGQEYTPEYIEEQPTHRQHLDNEIRTRDSYHDAGAHARTGGNGYMD
ncbi:hypothetical protein H4R19_003985, partial [Coemansia spiralis]